MSKHADNTLKKQAQYFEKTLFTEYHYNIKALKEIFTSIKHCTFKSVPAEELPHIAGQFTPADGTIKISAKVMGSPQVVDSTLIHEMVHWYDRRATDLQLHHLMEHITLKLYEKHRADIPKLEDLINSELGPRDAQHGYLFFLMCFDIEYRLRIPQGSVFGYWREQAWEKFNATPL